MAEGDDPRTAREVEIDMKGDEADLAAMKDALPVRETRLPDRDGTREAKRVVRIAFSVVSMVLVGLAIFLSWKGGEASGRATKALDAVREAECRAEAAAPVNTAQARIAAATALGLAAIASESDPVLAGELHARTGKDPDALLQAQIREIIAGSDDLTVANERRGPTPVQSCRDQKPFN